MAATPMSPAPELPCLLVHRDEAVAILTLNRPDQDNALNRALLRELTDAVLHLSSPGEGVRAAVLTGAGQCFSTGADLAELATLSPREAQAFSELGQAAVRTLEAAPFPILGAVHGFVLGGGLELVLGCDLVFASEDAVFGLPEITLGVIPGFGGTQRLVQRLGLSRTRELAYTGKTLSAERASAVGLVNRVVPSGRLLARTRTEAEALACRAPLALQRLKVLTREAQELSLELGCSRETQEFARLFGTRDAHEGLSAFLEQRDPEFHGD